MKRYFSLLLFLSISAHSQHKLFEAQIAENTLSKENKISDELMATYLTTKYYRLEGFDLKQNLVLKLPNNSIIEALYQNTISHTTGTFSAVYKIKNDASAELIFSQAENVITGMYISGENKKVVFQQSGRNIFAVSEVNEAVFSNKESLFDHDVAEDSGKDLNSILTNSNVCLAATPICTGITIIDLMVVYTPTARALWGSVAIANSTITSAVSNMNVALTNSGITNISFNLVYVGQITYSESGSFQTDLNTLKSSTDGVIDEIHTLRTNYGADLVGMVVGTPTGTCGIGNLNANATNYSTSQAFTVTLYSCLLSNFTLAHEFGHNMGFNHDWYVEPSTLPCSHHHGYTNRSAIINGASGPDSQKWRTIMAYDNECANNGFNCTRINRWSNPAITYNSEATGIAIGQANSSDEAFGIRRAACVVAGFTLTSLSTNEYIHTSFSVFPNPTKETLTIICDVEISDIKIYNYIGQPVLSTKEKVINTEVLVSGVYFIKIYDLDGKNLGVRKIIKE